MPYFLCEDKNVSTHIEMQKVTACIDSSLFSLHLLNSLQDYEIILGKGVRYWWMYSKCFYQAANKALQILKLSTC